jgi:hypothetical protein
VPATPFYGFTGQWRTYRINDQFGNPMPGVVWNEIWDNIRPDPRFPGWVPPTPGNGPADANGQVTDVFGYQNYNSVPAIAPALVRPAVGAAWVVGTNEVLMGTLRQQLWAGSATSGVGCGAPGGGPLRDYPNLEWHTNGVRGF